MPRRFLSILCVAGLSILVPPYVMAQKTMPEQQAQTSGPPLAPPDARADYAQAAQYPYQPAAAPAEYYGTSPYAYYRTGRPYNPGYSSYGGYPYGMPYAGPGAQTPIPPQQSSVAPQQQAEPSQNFSVPQSYPPNSNYSYVNPTNNSRYGFNYQQRFGTAPAGLVIPVTLATAISTSAAKPGDYVQADITQNIHLQGYAYIPARSTVSGEITEAQSGRLFNRSGSLSIRWDRLTLPNGNSISINAHVLGRIGKYSEKDGEYHGEGFGAKAAGFFERGLIGAGGGAILGTAVGAISAGGRGCLGGAWSGTAIGAGAGILDDLMLRHGRNIIIHSGTPMQMQLDEPVQIPIVGSTVAAT